MTYRYARTPICIYLNQHIDLSPLMQREISEACGFTTPNALSMIKLGANALAVGRAPALAEALGVPLAEISNLAAQSYLDHTCWPDAMDLHRRLVAEASKKRTR